MGNKIKYMTYTQMSYEIFTTSLITLPVLHLLNSYGYYGNIVDYATFFSVWVLRFIDSKVRLKVYKK